MTIEQAKEYIRQWILSSTTLNTVIEPFNAPQPERPYCSLFVLDVETIGDDYVDAGPVTTILRGIRDLTVEINCYGDFIISHMDKLVELRASIYNDDIIDWFRSHNFIQLDVDPNVSDTTYGDQEESHWVPRATTKVTFRIALEIEIPRFVINETTIGLTLKTGANGDINSTIKF